MAPGKTGKRPALGLVEQREQLLTELRIRIEPVPVSLWYRFGLVLVAGAMLLLPLIYLGLIGAAIGLVYLYAVNGIAIFSRTSGLMWRLLAYVGPLLAGGLLVVFMVKPLFAPSAREAPRLRLSRQQEPFLFQFIEYLCAAVGAPAPAEVCVDCDVNASASFRGELWSMLKGELTLTIGLPLVAALDLRQFAGVLAHEFGHFAQGTGMRLTYLVRRINLWFARVVYERDAWDEWLVQWTAGQQSVLGLVALLARAMIWLSRRALWVLMWLGHIVSSFMLRQMELDADRYEARVAGSSAFVQTCRMLPLLAVASEGAYADLNNAWKDRRLCDDLPMLIMDNLQTMPEDLRKKILQFMAEKKTGLFDSHPAEQDRINSAMAEDASGLLSVEGPARMLFGDFGRVARVASLALYRRVLGVEVEERNLIPAERFCRMQAGQFEQRRALRRFFQGQLTPARPVFFSAEPHRFADESSAAEAILEARDRMQRMLGPVAAVVKKLDEVDQQLVNVKLVQALHAAGFAKVPAADFGFMRADQAELLAARQQALLQRQEAGGVIDQLQNLAERRLHAALAIARMQGNAQASEQGHMGRLLRSLECLQAVYPKVLELRNEHLTLGVLLRNIQGELVSEPLARQIHQTARNCWGKLHEIYEALGPEPYPFEHAQGTISLGRYAIAEFPDVQNIAQVAQANESAMDCLYALYFRAMGELAQMAERIEASLGLEAWQEPAERQESGMLAMP